MLFKNWKKNSVFVDILKNLLYITFFYFSVGVPSELQSALSRIKDACVCVYVCVWNNIFSTFDYTDRTSSRCRI